MIKRLLVAAMSAPLLVFGSWSAQAAPQVLGLVATLEPVQLQCDRGVCSAELSTICLQQRRASPSKGQRYLIHDPDAMTAAGETADGARVALSLDDGFTVQSLRGHSAIRISAPAHLLRRLGLDRIEISVDRNVALVPEPVPGDRRPQTEADIRLASGPLLEMAGAVLAERKERVDAAQLTARMANSLPRLGRADDAARDGVWQAAIGERADQSTAAEMARQAYDRCHSLTRAGSTSLRNCLGTAHDIFIGRANTEYWDRTGAGS